MRKYFVTLLVVDQRPSGIDNEVMSQIGTRITALLNDEKDIDAIFTGVSGGQNLRSVLAKLDSKQQATKKNVFGIYAKTLSVAVRISGTCGRGSDVIIYNIPNKNAFGRSG